MQRAVLLALSPMICLILCCRGLWQLFFLALIWTTFAYANINHGIGTWSDTNELVHLHRTKDVIVQIFEWTWDSIASECATFIGPAGYGFVQVSPAQEHIQGDQWWTDYQPVSYNLTSKRGNRAQFKNMIDTCHFAGVKVIADTIFNHMSAQEIGTGVAGTTFKHYEYPGIYKYDDFHHCGSVPYEDINDYTNRTEVQACELVNLADLATEKEYVRARLAEYANDPLPLGVDGMRLDAAKYMAAADLANITSRFHGSPCITAEVIFGVGEPITPDEYLGIGDVQEFRYTSAVRNAFLDDSIAELRDLDSKGWIPGSEANVFVANHDTERNSANSLNNNSPRNAYTLAMIFSLAHPYGTPTILSSYDGFTINDKGAPNGGDGTCFADGGVDGWLCQHRWPAVSGMVGFRDRVNSDSTNALTNWVSPSAQRIAFARGETGFVAIDNDNTTWKAKFSSGLPPGEYCNVIEGAPIGRACFGQSFSVAQDGTLSASIPTHHAIAIHTGALGIGSSFTPSAVPVTLQETATLAPDEVRSNFFFLEGSASVIYNLHSRYMWNLSNSTKLGNVPFADETRGTTVTLPAYASFEYKFIRKTSNGTIIWESDPNRSATISTRARTFVTLWR